MPRIGPTYSARITIKGDLVTKKILRGSIPNRCDKDYTDLFDREIWALKRLKNHKHFPPLIDYNRHKLSIRMKWCGEPILSLPKNWEKQAQKIISTLNKLGIGHMDIKCKNITILNNTIYLIDFGKVKPLMDNINFPKHVKVSQKAPDNNILLKVLKSVSSA